MVIYDFMTLFPVNHGNTLGVLKNPWIITQNQAVEAPRAFSGGFFAALTCPGFNSLPSSPFCLMSFRSFARNAPECDRVDWDGGNRVSSGSPRGVLGSYLACWGGFGSLHHGNLVLEAQFWVI